MCSETQGFSLSGELGHNSGEIWLDPFLGQVTGLESLQNREKWGDDRTCSQRAQVGVSAAAPLPSQTHPICFSACTQSQEGAVLGTAKRSDLLLVNCLLCFLLVKIRGEITCRFVLQWLAGGRRRLPLAPIPSPLPSPLSTTHTVVSPVSTHMGCWHCRQRFSLLCHNASPDCAGCDQWAVP